MKIASIVELLDQEIERLQQVRTILSEVDPVRSKTIVKETGKKKEKSPAAEVNPQKRLMSPEGRARIAAAQKARWAAHKKLKKAAK
ncbi:hypothetical protein [Acidipila sp. EB88]|uniref:hypothetical protein n=1 Tax=Acidipila sp. EB88 TaxID=2305226 RepID=UPI000F5EFC6C|nr:hypothetical protein [Acidipila sp. EB88]RRA47429.1 hypothetical protein D1Y84_03085 [Acidipila sp. EB88]